MVVPCPRDRWVTGERVRSELEVGRGTCPLLKGRRWGDFWEKLVVVELRGRT